MNSKKWNINAKYQFQRRPSKIDTLAECDYLHMITVFSPNGVTQRREKRRFLDNYVEVTVHRRFIRHDVLYGSLTGCIGRDFLYLNHP